MSKQDSNRLYYEANRETILAKRRKYQEARKIQIQAYRKARRQKRLEEIYKLKSKPCTDCGGTFHPWQMEFDHLRDKKFNVSSLIGYGNDWQTVLDEVAKCDLVCANCHKHRTYVRSHQTCP